VGFGVLDIKAHASTILDCLLPFYLRGWRRKSQASR
jgi:hypothetical protein